MPTIIVAEEQQEEDMPCKKSTPRWANMERAKQVMNKNQVVS